ncbi:MAG: hypothetical protein ACOZAO_03625 [Patescibacteria group bacterium]
MNFLLKLLGLDKLFKGPARVSMHSVEKIQRDWERIGQQVAGGTPSQLRQAVITADKTLDNALRDLVEGETMGERLKNARHLYEADLYDTIWKAHKLRNSLVHETDFEPPHHVLEKRIRVFREALKEIGVKV